jgi:hypothetical protein
MFQPSDEQHHVLGIVYWLSNDKQGFGDRSHLSARCSKSNMGLETSGQCPLLLAMT